MTSINIDELQERYNRIMESRKGRSKGFKDAGSKKKREFLNLATRRKCNTSRFKTIFTNNKSKISGWYEIKLGTDK